MLGSCVTVIQILEHYTVESKGATMAEENLHHSGPV